ncbi:hypothetical protein TVAG_444180 [Trichomonas vaginalis G3]|uniref:Uncharacterized protein n=1 Tax=Trichomonas vaginalis (strain ATCC PRA-98 / G3) TaxID=412133 RepID=A2E2G0_TRIV3|nr:hypothetical protein TVAGG3_0305650 [Trichomonas vaginalis G3]EAY13135.1 hypothetical protein TVAG_444180 [Trichomonas vaginalis G3]KAI5528237.1 hypothetical protein TVAGG3_0305650 [Trichomonas vaginalis G3]|eukprot:XP_001325358.1 hypothetical protein [Trichomonas vaginalis G3]
MSGASPHLLFVILSAPTEIGYVTTSGKPNLGANMSGVYPPNGCDSLWQLHSLSYLTILLISFSPCNM